ncbi:MAG: hypothetical protein BWY69_01593 [Planctomycetes bacterium ADurb.Bin401]|nr:MAG: hypothetical protein BWY69_01593 [Planctomycetes bacterium ADurb.Bin401]
MRMFCLAYKDQPKLAQPVPEIRWLFCARQQKG